MAPGRPIVAGRQRGVFGEAPDRFAHRPDCLVNGAGAAGQIGINPFSLSEDEACGPEPGVENMLETCADAFGHKGLGHTQRPTGR